MKTLAQLLPHPLTSAALFLGWMLLQRSASPGNFLIAAAIALALPLFTRKFWPEPVPLRRPLVRLRFVVVVVSDICLLYTSPSPRDQSL